jgi:hypothetical protein
MSIIKPSLSRHSVENLDHGTRVSLPGKKNFFKILGFGLWLLGWAGILGTFLLTLTVMLSVGQGPSSGSSPVSAGDPGFLAALLFFLLFMLMLLGVGLPVLYAFLRQIAGREVIEADGQVLSITQQIFRWKSSRQYATEEVSDLRLNTQSLSSFPPQKSLQKLLGQDGLIAFDYGAKTCRFACEIDEAEAKQIISALRPWLPRA